MNDAVFHLMVQATSTLALAVRLPVDCWRNSITGGLIHWVSGK